MATKKSTGRKYSPAASKSVEREMKAMEAGTLTIGRSEKKVTNPKQAIAIGLSEARRAGKKVPPPPGETAAKKEPAKKAAARKMPSKKTAAKKSVAKKAAK